MIRNLNHLSFKSFGTVCAEKAISNSNKPDPRQELRLTQGEATVWQAKTQVWLSFVQGMTVLSVSLDGTDFQHFYLNKPVYIRPGVYFCLSPFRQESSTAEIYTQIPPEQTGGHQKIDDFRMQHKLWVTDLYTFFYHEKEKGFFFPGEAHPMLELTYVDRGSLHSVADGADLILEQGDMVLYGPNQWHMQYADIGVAPRFVTVSFDINGRIPEELFDRKLHAPQSVLTIFGEILREQERADTYSEDMILSLLSQLIIVLQREADAGAVKLKVAHTVHNENEIIRRAQQYISSHVRQKLSVPSVARQVDVSPSYLTALFHKHLQIAPGEYIRRIKLQESKQMIRENSMNFTEIAAALQYSTVHHFSRQFKEKFGITPTEYAKSVR